MNTVSTVLPGGNFEHCTNLQNKQTLRSQEEYFVTMSQDKLKFIDIKGFLTLAFNDLMLVNLLNSVETSVLLLNVESTYAMCKVWPVKILHSMFVWIFIPSRCNIKMTNTPFLSLKSV